MSPSETIADEYSQVLGKLFDYLRRPDPPEAGQNSLGEEHLSDLWEWAFSFGLLASAHVALGLLAHQFHSSLALPSEHPPGAAAVLAAFGVFVAFLWVWWRKVAKHFITLPDPGRWWRISTKGRKIFASMLMVLLTPISLMALEASLVGAVHLSWSIHPARATAMIAWVLAAAYIWKGHDRRVYRVQEESFVSPCRVLIQFVSLPSESSPSGSVEAEDRAKNAEAQADRLSSGKSPVASGPTATSNSLSSTRRLTELQRALMRFESNADGEEGKTATIAFLDELRAKLEDPSSRKEVDRMRERMKHEFQQNLRGARPHWEAVEHIVLVPSKSSAEPAKDLSSLFEQWFKSMRQLHPSLRRATSAPLITVRRPIDYENFDEIQVALRTLVADATSGALDDVQRDEHDVMIDITSGQKPNSATALLFSTGRRVKVQYVTSDPENHRVIAYDVMPDQAVNVG